MEKELLRDNLGILPDKIMKRETELFELMTQIKEIEYLNKTTETATYNLVCSEKTTEGKNVYTNTKMRDEENNKRLQGNPDYLQKTDEIGKMNKELKEKEIHLSFLKRSFRAAEALVRRGD